ncbi:MAG: AMP-binding protein [Bdellovibrionota bacterium]
MTDSLSNTLSSILTNSENLNKVFCYDNENEKTFNDFSCDIKSFYNNIKNLKCDTVGIYVLEDCYLFYTLFISSLYANKNILLLTLLNDNNASAIKEITDTVLTNESLEFEGVNCFLPLKESDISNIELPKIKNKNVMFFTSGSTNAPKCVVKTIESLVLEVKMHALAQRGIIEQSPVIVACVMPYHMYGMLWRFLFSYCNALSQDTSTIFYLEELLQKQEKYKKIVFISTPTFMDKIISYRSEYKFKDNCLKVFSSGSFLKKETSLAMTDIFNCSVCEIYGSTETGGIAYREQSKDEYFHVLEEVLVSLNEDTTLRVASPFSMVSPYDIQDSVTFVGDKAFILNGRIDRMVKISEKRLFLSEMEETLLKHKFVKDVHLLKTTSEKRDILNAIIVLSREGKEYLLKNKRIKLYADLKTYLSKFYESVLIPRKIRTVENLKTNAQGKIIKSKMISLLEDKVQELVMFDVSFSKDTLKAKLLFEENALFFGGHFPNFPIVPGVIELHYVFKYLKDYFNIIPKKYVVQRLKFTNLIYPNDLIDFKLEKISENEFSFIYEKDEKACSSGKIFVEN